MADFHIGRLTIFGVGLIGGSLGLALREKGCVDEIVGVGRTRKNLETAKSMGIIDSFTHDPAEAVEGADVVLLATPVESFGPLLKEARPAMKDGCIVTDVGSTKVGVLDSVRRHIGDGVHFVAAHPIAGTENTGAAAAKIDLFDGAMCILTPNDDTDAGALALINDMWEAVGMRIIQMSPEGHDRVLGAVSHLPHMVAYALVLSLLRWSSPDEVENHFQFVGGGFRDFTRIAKSSPNMWRDICAQNAPAIIESIEGFEESLGKLKALIQDGKFEELNDEFSQAQEVLSRVGADQK